MLLKKGYDSLRTKVAIRALSSTTTKIRPLVELREYQIFPEHVEPFMKATTETADLRKRLVPLRFFSLPETGGQLHVATHAYYYGRGHADRDARRAAMAQDADWCAYIARCRPFVQSQSSLIFLEASLGQDDRVPGVKGILDINDSGLGEDGKSILEVRRYKLKLGYDTVPKFLDLYMLGLPSKLDAPGTDPTTSLVTLLYSDVGRLNEVIELWRHGDGTSAMERSRVAARQADEWRQSIARIADLAVEFTSTIHKPASFSPIR